MRLSLHRIGNERRTIACMVRLYCRGRHGSSEALCRDCQALLDYAHRRLDGCVYGEDKPVCARCPVHCYRPAMRKQMIAVMRYAGPRMLFRHPILAAAHLLHSLARPPRRNASGKKPGARDAAKR